MGGIGVLTWVKLAGAGILLAGACAVGFSWWERGQRIEELNRSLDTVKEANAEFGRQLALQNDLNRMSIDAMARQMEAERQTDRRLSSLLEGVRRDAATDDRPVGPVLRNLRERMRAGSRAETGAAAAGGATGPAELRRSGAGTGSGSAAGK